MDSNTVQTFSLTNPVIVILDCNRIKCGVTRFVEQHAHARRDSRLLLSKQEVELQAAVRRCLRGARAMVLALVTVIDYFSDVVGFREQGCIKSV
jgi:hypothetical protein